MAATPASLPDLPLYFLVKKKKIHTFVICFEMKARCLD